MKPGRNDPCSCGSGKKFKHCCEGKIAPRSAGPSPDEFNPLVTLFNTGRYAELESRASALTERYPRFGFAWKLLGASLQMQGKNALIAFQKTAELMPGDAEAHFNLGVVLKGLGQLDDAVASYRRALKLNPGYAEAHSNLGNVLKDLGQLNDALASYSRALQLKPNSADTHNNLGTALRDLGKLDDALASYRRAVALKPDFADAHYNLGNVLRDIGKLDDAVASYRRAVEIRPSFADALINLGTSLKELSQFDNAMACYRRVVEIKPDFAEVHGNIGSVLKEIGQFDGALASYRRALELKPDYADAQSSLLFILNYTTSHPPSYYLAEAHEYGRMTAKKVTAQFSNWQCEKRPNRLRVGMISGDLRNHPVGHFLEGVLSHIDPAHIELIAYPTHHKEDELTARIRPHFSAWKPLIGKSDEAAACLIHADAVHVLLDISGHTAHNRLPVFAWKPAPAQVTWLALPSTTGVNEMDYVLGDPLAIPPEHEHHFSETVWRLPESYLCFSTPAYPVNVAPLPALSTGYVTFGSFNNLTKMNDAVVELWARVLLSVPNSRLYLKSGQLNDADVREQTRQRFAAWDIDQERLLLGRTLGSIADHLSEYNKIDVALDTFPYPGVTTSIEALWMGVPVLTMHGDRFLSLTAKSIAHHAGLPDWIAVDQDNYVAKAVAFTSNLEQLATLRAGLRQQVVASPLFDAPRFARNFEDALWGMWQASRDSGRIP